MAVFILHSIFYQNILKKFTNTEFKLALQEVPSILKIPCLGY